jgi:hypothetical protein
VYLNHEAVYRLFCRTNVEILCDNLNGIFYEGFCIRKLVALSFTEDTDPP